MSLLNGIKKQYSKCYASYMQVKAYIESRILRLTTPRLEGLSDLRGKIIILAPHSDDEWVGCSQLIRNNPKQVLVVNMDMMGGDSNDIHEIRYAEMLLMSKNNNTDIVTITGDELLKSLTLKSVIRNYNPSYICVPFYYDWHPEHLLTRTILYDAIAANDEDIEELNIIEYQVSVPIPHNKVTHCEKMTKEEQMIKWRLFSSIYKSQEFFPVWRFKYNEFISGKYCSSYSCENYSVTPAKKWVRQFEGHTIDENKRIAIMGVFRSLLSIRKLINSLEQDISG